MPARPSAVGRRTHPFLLPLSVLFVTVAAAGSGVEARPFLPAPVYAAGINPSRVAAADFNGDGRSDVAVANANNPGDAVTVSVLLSQGGGLFRDGGVVTTAVPSPVVPPTIVLAAGDFNQDGKQDLVLETGQTTASFLARVLLGAGDGTFTAVAPDLALTGLLTVGDSNADGRLDLLVRSGSGATSQLQVWIGAGNGTFSGLAPFTAPAGIDFGRNPFSAGDLNGDHIADVVATASTGTSSVVLKGNANGTFTAGQTIASLPNVLSVLGDATGDGVVDLVLQAHPPSIYELRAWRGHGDGTFDATPFWTRNLGSAFLNDIAMGDLNRDGFTDLVTLSNNLTLHEYDTAQIWIGSGASFTPSATFRAGLDVRQTALGDFDGASGLDFAVVAALSRTVTFVLARPNGSYLPVRLPAPEAAYNSEVVAADFNGDGRADMAALHAQPFTCTDESCPYGEVEVRLAQPAGGFATASLSITGWQPQALHAADLDLDGKPDLFSVDLLDDPGTTIIENGALSLFRGHGDGTFDLPVIVPAGQWPRWAAAGDLDHDGDVDLVHLSGRNSSATVLLRTGAGTYIPQTPITVGRNPIQVDLADVDGDAMVDLVVTAQGNVSSAIPGEVAWLRGHGNGTFDPRVVITTVEWGAGLATGDLDGDGDVDFAISDAGDTSTFNPADPGGVTVLLHQAGATFTPSTPYRPGFQPGRPRFADLNGDGTPDLMVEASANLAVFPGLGGGLFGAVERFASLNCGLFRPARLVGDGDLDLFGTCDNLAVFENEADQNPDLRFLDNTRLNWAPISFVGAFDVIQGSLPLLRSTGGNFGTAVQACVMNNGAQHALDIPATPAIGSGNFYLARAVRPNGTPGTYDGEGPQQAAPRDASIATSAAACP